MRRSNPRFLSSASTRARFTKAPMSTYGARSTAEDRTSSESSVSRSCSLSAAAESAKRLPRRSESPSAVPRRTAVFQAGSPSIPSVVISASSRDTSGVPYRAEITRAKSRSSALLGTDGEVSKIAVSPVIVERRGIAKSAGALRAATRNQGSSEYLAKTRPRATMTGSEGIRLPAVSVAWKATRGFSSPVAAKTCGPSRLRCSSASLRAVSRIAGWSSASASSIISGPRDSKPSRIQMACKRAVGSAAFLAMSCSGSITVRSCRSTSKRWAVRRCQPFGCVRNSTSSRLDAEPRSIRRGLRFSDASGTMR